MRWSVCADGFEEERIAARSCKDAARRFFRRHGADCALIPRVYVENEKAPGGWDEFDTKQWEATCTDR